MLSINFIISINITIILITDKMRYASSAWYTTFYYLDVNSAVLEYWFCPGVLGQRGCAFDRVLNMLICGASCGLPEENLLYKASMANFGNTSTLINSLTNHYDFRLRN